MDYIFILAGGSGTRLWPASSKKRPKQFIKLIEGRSLFQLSLLRAALLNPSKGIIVISLNEQKDLVKQDLQDLPSLGVSVYMLPEPYGRNTAPAIASPVFLLAAAGESEAKVLVLASDHLIQPDSAFSADVVKAEELLDKGFITTFGIPPLHPETGYGYIEAGETEARGMKVKNFKEKPDRETAEMYVKTGRFFWNSGMFAFTVKDFIRELNKNAPEICTEFGQINLSADEFTGAEFSLILNNEEFRGIYKNMPSISVDYAVMEKCSMAAVVPASFSWNDLGSWDEIAKHLSADLDKELVFPENPSNFVYSDIPVSIQGLDDLIVVIKEGRCLICRKGGSQAVKESVNYLKKTKREDLL